MKTFLIWLSVLGTLGAGFYASQKWPDKMPFAKASEKVDGGRRLVYEATIEIEGSTRPALVAETITLVFD